MKKKSFEEKQASLKALGLRHMGGLTDEEAKREALLEWFRQWRRGETRSMGESQRAMRSQRIGSMVEKARLGKPGWSNMLRAMGITPEEIREHT